MEKRGLANIIQVVLIIVLALVLAGILAFMIHRGITESTVSFDAQMLVLQSDFSIISAANDPGNYLDITVKRESGSGTFPTLVIFDSYGKNAIKSYDGSDINVYQTVTVRFTNNDLLNAGFKVSEGEQNSLTKIEVYASAKDRNGNIVNSKAPKDVKIMAVSLVPIPPGCGNGIINSAEGETCDDNNTIPGDGCGASCQIESGWNCTGEPSNCYAICGDGLIRNGEECDDHDTDSGDGCSPTCHIEQYWNCTGEPSNCYAVCGDDYVVVGQEECDDGNRENCDGCAGDCNREDDVCGDGIEECGEACDDGNTNQSDGCYNNCTLTYCGDSIIQYPNGAGVNELCDRTNLNGQSCTSIGMGFNGGTLACAVNCQAWDTSGCTAPPTQDCGNGVVEPPEICDDGNELSCSPYPGCRNDCLWREECGNHQTECTEQCDDGGATQQCTASCTRTYCGDGVTQSPNGYGENEQCDDADTNNNDECIINNPSYKCKTAYCGDTYTWSQSCGNNCEGCDDGNTNPNDLCDQCTVTYCGDGHVQNPNGDGSGYQGGHEQCDMGSSNSNSIPNRCRTNCRNPWCGDGVCDAGESGGGLMPSPPYYAATRPIGGGASQQTGGFSNTHGSQGSSQEQNQHVDDDSSGGCPQDCGGGYPNPKLDLTRVWGIDFTQQVRVDTTTNSANSQQGGITN